jgi:hypothetical protein
MGYNHAESISEKINLNGFLSQGYVYSTHNDFIPQSSRNGSFELNEFGLTFSADVSKKLRVGFQVLARDFGPMGNHQLKLDWGFADYRISNALGIRIGKIKAPFGLYNEIRDTDALYPMVILPQSIYDEAKRAVFVAYNGIGVHGSLDFGTGGLNYHFFTGGVNHPEVAPYMTQIQTAINTGMSMAGLGMSISPIAMDTQFYFGGRLIWRTPINGFRMGGSYLSLRSEFNSMLTVPLMGQMPVFGAMRIKDAFFLSAEWAIGNFTLSSEYMELPVQLFLTLFGQEMELLKEIQQGWYVMGSYVFNDKLTLYGFYDQFYADKGDTIGYSSIRLGNPGYYGWQKEWVAGLRYDVSFNWTIKVEYHIIDGLAKSYVFFVGMPETEQKWNMVAAKISYNF